MIKLQNIYFTYNNIPLDYPALINKVSLNFKSGKFYSILGPNGCGKTTLLDLMIGHTKPISGEIFLKTNNSLTNNNVIGEKNICSMSKMEIARQIALVSQNYNINFPFTVKDVVMMGRHPYIGRFANPSKFDIEIVERVMEITDTDRFAKRKITDLSGGERQRCVFARALAQDTPIIFLDEAFSNMDINHTIKLLSLVKKEVKEHNRTVVSIFHDINLASIWSDELVFIKNGVIAASGQSEKIMQEDIIEAVFDVKPKIEYNAYLNSKIAYFREI